MIVVPSSAAVVVVPGRRTTTSSAAFPSSSSVSSVEQRQLLQQVLSPPPPLQQQRQKKKKKNGALQRTSAGQRDSLHPTRASRMSPSISSLEHCTTIAQPHEYGEIADVHCRAFYPGNVSSFWHILLRLDRVLALDQGYAMSEKGFPFHCLVSRMSGNINQECLLTDRYDEEETQSPVFSAEWILRKILDRVLESKTARIHQDIDDDDVDDTTGRSTRSSKSKRKTAARIVGAVCVDTNMNYIPRQRFTWPAFFNGSIYSLAPRKPMAYISNLAVSPSERRSGIGRNLVLAAESLAVQEWGATCCTLHVDPMNTAAYQLYTRLGYRYVSRQDAWTAFLEGRKQDSRLVLLYKKLS